MYDTVDELKAGVYLLEDRGLTLQIVDPNPYMDERFDLFMFTPMEVENFAIL